jgi:hypothetical protein
MQIRSAIGPQRAAGFGRAARWVLVVGPALLLAVMNIG